MSDSSSPTQRTFARRRILRVTPHGYEAGLRQLADAVTSRFGDPSMIMGIANGGLAPANALASLLAAPVLTINARHNPTNAIYTQATGSVTVDLGPFTTALAGRRLSGRVLLVDDICGTGATFDAIEPLLTGHLTPEGSLVCVSLCRNAGTGRDPDLWLWTVDDWVWFPWEDKPSGDSPVEDLPVPQGVQPR